MKLRSARCTRELSSPGIFAFSVTASMSFTSRFRLAISIEGSNGHWSGGPGKRTIHLMETLCGDTSIGHATAYCEAVEALSGTAVSARAQVLRGIALELERLANHTGDLGALAGDVGYLPTAAYCGRIRGDFLNLTAALCGSRFGRGMIRPGGVGFDLDKQLAAETAATVGAAIEGRRGRGRTAVGCVIGSGAFRAYRGNIARNCRGAWAGRSRGARMRRRARRSTGFSRAASSGSRRSRSRSGIAATSLRGHGCDGLKFSDRAHSFESSLPLCPRDRSGRQSRPLQPNHLVVSLVEGWRGEICHVAITDAAGSFAHYKVVDPSFHNWMGLAIAMRDQQISDFPLCNKSFNLSYCGHDL